MMPSPRQLHFAWGHDLEAQLQALATICQANAGVAAWLGASSQEFLAQMQDKDLAQFTFLDSKNQVLAGTGAYQVMLIDLSNAKRILGYNFSGIVYNYYYEHLSLAQQQKNLHAHNLLYCLATVQEQGYFYFFTSPIAEANSYLAYVVQTAQELAQVSAYLAQEQGDSLAQEQANSLGQEQANSFAQEQVSYLANYQDLIHFWQQEDTYAQQKAQAQQSYQTQLAQMLAQLQTSTQKTLWLFTGQRGTGKTKFSLDLIQALGQGAITSLGKRQVYANFPYLAPEVACQEQGKVLLVDEASALSALHLQQLLASDWQHLIFLTTIDGYESGAGVGLWHKVIPQSQRQLQVYYFDWHFRALVPDVLSRWQELLSGTTSLETLLQSQALPYTSMATGKKFTPVVPQAIKHLDFSQLQWQKLTSFASKLEFFKLAYLTHYRHQVQDFASAFAEQELYALFYQGQLIGGVHLIPESLPQGSELQQAIIAGTRLPPGNLGIQTLMQYFALSDELRHWQGARISRIFLKPEYRHLGLGKFMVQQCQDLYPQLLVMYSQHEQTSAFWQACGFVNVCYLANANKSTGKGNLLALYGEQEVIKALGELYQLSLAPEANKAKLHAWEKVYPAYAQKLKNLLTLSQQPQTYIKSYRLIYAQLFGNK
ncbi:hypothetical protein CJP74_01990 [Psittacicella melopsittaci]|uniref:TcmA/NAT10 helicase domain-containing protein n=1 Tax=Psittacicella melopsittaci TaxID=2028576 RepID=A0A3A1Y792_9GAMM|nr:tRNA(Met) cytidine acetyltransferase TmcA [Psittacicella melopsittaci]RIY33381.1 hypothetical protein CJP74_01990 [Psittacicella melopsittaci]